MEELSLHHIGPEGGVLVWGPV